MNNVLGNLLRMNFIFNKKGNEIDIKGKLYKTKIRILEKSVNNKIIIEKNAILKNCKIRIKGNNNLIIIKENTRLINSKLDIREYGNKLVIENECELKNSLLFFQNINSNIFIDKNTTCEGMKLISTEPFDIKIGKNCILSYDIEIRNTDSHEIFSMLNGKRINEGKEVIIEDKVWIGTRCVILKGSIVEKGAILGAGSILSGRVESNSIYAGIPAKKIKNEIYWKR